MTNSLIVLGVMLAVLVAGSFVRKIPVAVLLVIASIAGAVVGGAVGVAVLLGATPAGWCVLAVATAAYVVVDAGIRIWREIDERRFLSAEDLAAFGIRPDAFPGCDATILETGDDRVLGISDSTLAWP